MIKRQSLLEFLLTNMAEMETELRAHSIVLEALETRVITPEQIPGCLTLARESNAMLAHVEQKYEHLMQREFYDNGDANIDFLNLLGKGSGITH